MVWGPQFVAQRAMRLWLPDGQPVKLELPLPKTITISKRLNPAGRRS
jgi:hypothetical protein